MPAGRRDLAGHGQRRMVLHRAQHQVEGRPAQGQARQHRFSPEPGEDHQRDHRHREQRVDDRDDAPGKPLVAEGPEQHRAVGRAGIQKRMGGVAQRAEQKGLQKRQAPPSPEDPVEGQRAEQAADRNEDQRVRELAMILEEQQGVRLGADKGVEVGRHTGDEPEGAGDPDLRPVARRLRQRRADRALG